MARDLFDLAASAGAAAAALKVASKVGVRKAALHVTTEVRTEIRRAVGGDMRMSGVGRRGARVGASFDVRGDVNPTALIKGTGAIMLIEKDTPAHRIPKSGGRKKRVVIDGHPYHHAFHPGTSGKQPFAKGVAKAGPDTPKIFQSEIRKAIEKAWGI